MNYLIPSDARIASETFLKTKALGTQSVLDTLQGARNALNVVVLDACRDNSFSWSRSGSRGLSVVGTQPPGSIVAYATSAGSVAQDGTERNGVFTAELLKHIKTPGLEIKEVFNRTGKAVSTVSLGKQVPAVYSQFFDSAYLSASTESTISAPAKAPSFGTVKAATGNLSITLATAGTVSVASLSAAVPAGTVPVNDLAAGSQTVTVRYADGKTESATVNVPSGGTAGLSFSYVPAPSPAPAVTVAAPAQRAPGESLRGEIYVQGGSFQMGSDSGDSDVKPVHTVRVSDFWMMKTEVTQKDYAALMGTNPSWFKGDNLPVEKVSWYDAVNFANKLSQKDGLRPAYTISGTTVSCDFSAPGWRLPTEAEWEYAARGGNKSWGYTYAGGNDTASVAWYSDNSGNTTKPVGTKGANELGIYDMSGNVWEWCWDWFGNYASGTQTDPTGAAPGSGRVARGGGWKYGASNSRSAVRGSCTPGSRFSDIGFRLLRPLVR